MCVCMKLKTFFGHIMQDLKFPTVIVMVRSLSYVSLWSHGLQHTQLPRPSLSPGVCSDSYLLSRGCYLTFSSSDQG